MSLAIEALAAHLAYVESKRQKWSDRYAMYDDRAWQGSDGGSMLVSDSNRPSGSGLTVEAYAGPVALVQENAYGSHAASYRSSLFYKGVRSSVAFDGVGMQADPEKAAAVRQVVNRIASPQQGAYAAAGEHLTLLALLFEGGEAVRVYLSPEAPKGRPEDRLRLDVVPPWEAVFDRRCRSMDDLEVIGHFRQLSLTRAKELYPEASFDEECLDAAWRWEDGQPGDRQVRDRDLKRYVWVYEAANLVEGKDGQLEVYQITDPRALRTWDPDGSGAADAYKKLLSGPLPVQAPDGSPTSHIIPVIVDPRPGYACDSKAVLESLYELNEELNKARSVLASAFRRDANRIILYLKDHVSAETLSKVVHSPDATFIGLDGNTLVGLFEALSLPPISNSLLLYLNQVRDSIESVQLTADTSRGKSGEYLSATEAAALVAYTETTIGRVKSQLDRALARALHLSLLALSLLIDKGSLSVSMGSETVELSAEDLELPWQIAVLDSAATPQIAAAKVAEFVALLPTLLELAKAMSEAAVPVMAEAALDHLVRIADLPEDFSPAVILEKAQKIADELAAAEAAAAAAQAPPATPEQLPPASAAAPAPITPEEVAASPEAAAIVSTAEEGL